MLAFYVFRDCVVSLEGCESHRKLWLTLVKGLAKEYNLPQTVEESLGDLPRAVTHGFYEDGCIYVSDILSVQQLEALTKKFGKCKAKYIEDCFTSSDHAELFERMLFYAEDESIPSVDDLVF